jgi:hypothetical protein
MRLRRVRDRPIVATLADTAVMPGSIYHFPPAALQASISSSNLPSTVASPLYALQILNQLRHI